MAGGEAIRDHPSEAPAPDLITLAARRDLLDEATARAALGGRQPTAQILLELGLIRAEHLPPLLADCEKTLALAHPAGALCARCGRPLARTTTALACDPCNLRIEFAAPAAVTPERYERRRKLGEGGFGEVWLAHDRELGREVAIKYLTAASGDDLARFKREACLAAQLSHPGIVAVHDVGDRFLVMDYIPGRAADEVPLSPRQAAEIVRQAAGAVAFAHSKGVIHRDLKPQNIIVAGDRAYVTDFGLAKSLGAESSLSISGMIMGTPSYMSPEQARGNLPDVGPHSDVYSLGAALFALLAGHPPFRGKDAFDTIRRVIEEEPPPLRTFNPKVERDLVVIVAKAMEKEPARRYAGAANLAADLERYLKGEAIAARPASFTYRARKRIARNPWTWCAGAAAVAFGAVAVAAGLLLLLGGGEERRREEARRQVEAIRPQIDDARNDLYRRGVTLEAMDRKLRAAAAEIDRIEREVAPVAEGEILKAQALSSLSEANLSERIFNEVREAFRRAEDLDPAHPALPVVRGAFYVRRLAFEDVVSSLTYGALGKEAPWLDEVGAAAQRDAEQALRAGIDARLTRVLFEVAGAAMAGEYARAEEIVDREAAVDPHEELWLQKAYLRLRETDFARSQEAAERALDLRPNYVDAHLVRAVCLIRTREYEAAGVVADQLLALAPGGPIALFLRCVAHVTKREWEAAADMARAAVEGAKGEPLPQALAGLALILTGHPEEGVRAVEADSAGARAIRALGLYESGDVEGARREMEAASATRPAAAAVFGVRAQVEFYQRGDAARAEEFVNFALGYADRCAVLYVVRGQVRMESRLNVLGGMQDLQRAGELDPWWREFIRGELQREP